MWTLPFLLKSSSLNHKNKSHLAPRPLLLLLRHALLLHDDVPGPRQGADLQRVILLWAELTQRDDARFALVIVVAAIDRPELLGVARGIDLELCCIT